MFQFSKKFLVIAAALTAALTSCSSSSGQKNVLVLGTASDYPPYEFIDDRGQLAGFDIEIAERIAAMVGKKLVVKQMGFDALILALKNKKIDLLISGMSITEERMKEIALVPYNGEKMTEMQLIFWNGTPSGVHSIQDLKNRVVAAQTGTLQEKVLHRYTHVQHKSLDAIMDLVMDLKYGKSTAALVEPGIGNELKYKYREISVIPLPLLPEEQTLGDGIGIRKDNEALIAEVEKSVKALKESGELKKLHQKWFHTGE